MNFDFISDEKFRKILDRDFNELNLCIQSKADKSVLILSGSIIESILTEYFSSFPVENISPKKIQELDLYKLLELAHENNLISKSTKDLSTVIKNYRNLIHPGREIRKGETFDHDTAIVAKSVLNIVLKEVRNNYIKKIGYSADDIINKLENDAVTESIFEKIIEKINKVEKNKLFLKLIDYDSDLPFGVIENPKKYIEIIKKYTDKTIIKNKIDDLIQSIHIGEEKDTVKLFNILNKDIRQINKNDREIILLYMLSVTTKTTKDVDKVKLNVKNDIFSIFGEYINETDEIKNEVVNMLIALVENYNNDSFTYFSAYDQIRRSLPNDMYEDIEDLVKGGSYDFYYKPFFKDYDNGNFFPF